MTSLPRTLTPQAEPASDEEMDELMALLGGAVESGSLTSLRRLGR